MENIINMEDFGKEYEDGVPLKDVVEKLKSVSDEKEFDFVGRIISEKKELEEVVGIINTENGVLTTIKMSYLSSSNLHLIW